nr:reverse transcriptase domain-containing protein [Tanacetum cinerariifolium]
MLRACPHHGFSELTQIDTFYNGLNEQDQDFLNAAAGGNLLSKTTREALKIIENKSKVRYSRCKSNVSKVNTNSRESSRRSFLRTGRALIDVYGEEITLRVNDESVTFNLNQTIRYSSTYDDNSVNRIDVIDITCEEYAQDVLDFKYNSKSGNPTMVSNPSLSKETKSEFCKEPIVKSSSSTLTPFGESDFLLEESEDFLKDESIPTGIEDSYYDPKGDILYLETLLNDDPSQQAEETKAKSSIEEPPKLELKELPSHLEYVFLEETDKLPVIIAKDLKDDEKKALLKILNLINGPLLGKSPTSRPTGDHWKLQLNELNELHDQAYENSLIYKERTKKLHDSKIKNRIFNVSDQVLLFNSCLKIFSRKLKTCWSGPFTITHVFPYGTVELSQPDGPNFKVNGHRVKHYFGGYIPSKVVPDLHTIPMVK